ncbi:hypothetical protein J6590_055600 [Homalodisca vitripennis]|nr:hypothetical protein J6590_055600 [Homalodisca vitripennis]
MESGASSATHAAPDADNLNKFFTAGVEEVRRSIQPTNTSAIALSRLKFLYQPRVSDGIKSALVILPGRSTIDAVDELISFTHSNLEVGLSTGAVLCYLSKAFDCVDRDILLNKTRIVWCD